LSVPHDRDGLRVLLESGGFVAAAEEADELLAAAGDDHARLEAMVARRQTGEPLAWITGTAEFCGLWLRVDPGVYVPRWQSEPLAERAAERLPAGGVAIDVCTGCGALARVAIERRPSAQVLACDRDPGAVACARENGVDALLGDLFTPIPPALRGRVDVVMGVVPYVPTSDLPLLQRDTFAFESERSYDGGADGTEILRRVVEAAPGWLRPNGALLLELGGRQAERLRALLDALGFRDVAVIRDEEGDPRGFEATLGGAPEVIGRAGAS
jgi:release factor glutamine methyltransferase